MQDEHSFEPGVFYTLDEYTQGTLDRIRVPGGWLYVRDIVSDHGLMVPPATALAFVPDAPKPPKATRGCRVRRIKGRPQVS